MPGEEESDLINMVNHLQMYTLGDGIQNAIKDSCFVMVISSLRRLLC